MNAAFTYRPIDKFMRVVIIVLALPIFTIGQSFSQRTEARETILLGPLIQKIKSEKNQDQRTKFAHQLAAVVLRANPSDVSAEDIRSLTLLLENKDDMVRYFVAAALGHLGPRANGAAPALKKALDRIKCRTEEKNSESTIVPALQKIEGKRPVVRCN